MSGNPIPPSPDWTEWGISTDTPSGFQPRPPERHPRVPLYAWIADLRSSYPCTHQLFEKKLYVECNGPLYHVAGHRLIRERAQGEILGRIGRGLLSRHCYRYECFGHTYYWDSPSGLKSKSAEAALGDRHGRWMFSYDWGGGNTAPLGELEIERWGNPKLVRPSSWPPELSSCFVEDVTGNATGWTIQLSCPDGTRFLRWDGKAFATTTTPPSPPAPHASRPAPNEAALPDGSIELRVAPPSEETNARHPTLECKLVGTAWDPVGIPLVKQAPVSVFEHRGALWIVTGAGLFSTRRPRGLWVAFLDPGPLNQRFHPLPLFAGAQCPSVFAVRHTATTLKAGLEEVTVRFESELYLEDGPEWFYGKADGHFFFGVFDDSGEAEGIRICLQRNRAKPIESMLNARP